MGNENPEGWPLTDPYPFRGLDTDFELVITEPPDCPFVVCDKKYVKEANADEIGNYALIVKPAWQRLNKLYQEVQELKDHIKWLENVGGEHLTFACGIDVVRRGLVIKKRQQEQS